MSKWSAIERDPNPEHEPVPGDEYLHHRLGIVIRVVAVTKYRVTYQGVTGWMASSDLDWFKQHSRRVLPKGTEGTR